MVLLSQLFYSFYFLGWIWLDMAGYGWIWLDMAGYGWIWLDIQCSGKSLASQSGVQSMYGGVTLSDDMTVLSGKSGNSSKDKPAPAIFVIVAFVAIFLSIILYALHLTKGDAQSGMLGSILAFSALILLVFQLIVGFPIANDVDKKNSSNKAPSSSSTNQPSMNLPEIVVSTKTSFAFYLVLALLAVPPALMIKESSDQKK